MDESRHRKENGLNSGGEWMMVELLGHNRIAGFVTEESRFGQVLLRIDISTNINIESKQMEFTTQFYGTHALYCATPIRETDAIQLAQALRPKPFDKFDLHREANCSLTELTECENCGADLTGCYKCGHRHVDMNSF